MEVPLRRHPAIRKGARQLLLGKGKPSNHAAIHIPASMAAAATGFESESDSQRSRCTARVSTNSSLPPFLIGQSPWYQPSPKKDELLMNKRWRHRPAGSNWGEFGNDDQHGRMN